MSDSKPSGRPARTRWGLAQAAFFANLDDIRAQLDARRPIKVIHEALYEKLEGMAYYTFRRLVSQELGGRDERKNTQRKQSDDYREGTSGTGARPDAARPAGASGGNGRGASPTPDDAAARRAAAGFGTRAPSVAELAEDLRREQEEEARLAARRRKALGEE